MSKTHHPLPKRQDVVHIHNLRVWIKSKYPTKASSKQIKRGDRALFNKQQKSEKYMERKTKTIKQEHTRRMTTSGRKADCVFAKKRCEMWHWK
jgi:hypothetical protein